MIIKLDLDAMPKSTRERILKVVKRMAHEGRQANRVAPGSYSTTTEAACVSSRLGLEKIYDWAAPVMKPVHLDAFIKAIGRNICGLLLHNKCKSCPAKLHNKDQATCQMVLGIYAMHKFKEEGSDNSRCSQKST